MDPTILFGEAAKLGFVVLLLLFAVVYLVRRDDRIQNTDRERTAKMLSDNRKDCIDREQDLSNRLRTVEDRQHGESAELLRRSCAALEKNANAFEIMASRDQETRTLERR